MWSMFNGCESLKILNIYNFNTINVVDMRYMFCRCISLNKFTSSNFNINNNTNINGIIDECSDELKNKIKEKIKIIKA